MPAAWPRSRTHFAASLEYVDNLANMLAPVFHCSADVEFKCGEPQDQAIPARSVSLAIVPGGVPFALLAPLRIAHPSGSASIRLAGAPRGPRPRAPRPTRRSGQDRAARAAASDAPMEATLESLSCGQCPFRQ